MRGDPYASGTLGRETGRSIRKQSGCFLYGSVSALAGCQKSVGLCYGQDSKMAWSGKVWYGTGACGIADFWRMEELVVNESKIQSKKSKILLAK